MPNFAKHYREAIARSGMIFTDGLVDIDTINSEQQAQACVDFLRSEVQRHVKAQSVASRWADYHSAKARMYQSAVDRHQPDITNTNAKIAAVCDRWGLAQ